MNNEERQRLERIANAIHDALADMERNPHDSVADIWDEHLESWKTGLRFTSARVEVVL